MKIRLDPLDRLFSRYIRLRDGGICQRCGKYVGLTQGLHCAHFHGRANRNTRYEFDNELTLCYPLRVGRRRTLPDRECLGCGKVFRPSTSKVRFCSLECSYKNRPKKGTIRKCPICGREFYRSASRKSAKYCSRRCAYRGLIRGAPLRCAICGKEYYRPPSQIKWRGSNYCSYACKGKAMSFTQRGSNSPSWKGGVSTENHLLRASKRWKEWREAIFRRDNYICQDCGVRSGNGKAVFLVPHHIKSFAQYPELRFEVSNGITVCEQCHKKRHYAK